MKPLFPFCEKTYLSLRIFSKELIPEKVTEDLGIAPSLSHRKGDFSVSEEVRISKPWKKYFTYPSGMWMLSTEKSVDSIHLSDHIDFIFKQISGKSMLFKQYRTLGYDIDLHVFWRSATFGGGPFISYVNAARLAKYKIDLDFGIYDSGYL